MLIEREDMYQQTNLRSPVTWNGHIVETSSLNHFRLDTASFGSTRSAQSKYKAFSRKS